MEEILIHALYQINAQLNDKFPLSVKMSNIRRIVREAIKYYEDNGDFCKFCEKNQIGEEK